MKTKLIIAVAVAFILVQSKTAHAQLLIDPIDPTVAVCSANGNCTVYHVPTSLALPSGTTTIVANVSLSKALAAVEDDLFSSNRNVAAGPGHPPGCPPQNPCDDHKPKVVADGPEPFPPCWPGPPCLVPRSEVSEVVLMASR